LKPSKTNPKRMRCLRKYSMSENYLITSAYAVPLNGETPDQIMFFPVGKSTIRASVNGKPKQISVNVTKQTADVMQASLTQLLTEPVEPFIDFDHQSQAAAALPKGFEWKEGEGVMLNLEWTLPGKAAVEGKSYRYFSPTFLLSESGDPASLPDSGPVGALTNNPAFRRMKKISASDEGALTGDDEPPEQKGKKKMANETAEPVTAALRTELEALRAENKTLRDSIESQRVESVNREADILIEAAIRDHKIAPKNEKEKENLRKWFLFDKVAAAEHIEGLKPNPAFKTVVTVTSAHRDIGKPPQTSADSNGSSGKLCNAKVQAIRSQFPNMTYEEAWRKAEAEFPDLFQKVEA
jgi:phage I-like protein